MPKKHPFGISLTTFVKYCLVCHYVCFIVACISLEKKQNQNKSLYDPNVLPVEPSHKEICDPNVHPH